MVSMETEGVTVILIGCMASHDNREPIPIGGDDVRSTMPSFKIKNSTKFQEKIYINISFNQRNK